MEKFRGYQPKDIGEIVSRQYSHLVVDPYAVSLKHAGPRRGDARLSFYSSFIVNTAHKLYKAKVVDNLILFSDASFGSQKASTADLMEAVLLRRGVPRENIISFDEPELNQTVTQVNRLKQFRQEQGISAPFLYIVWNYHAERVSNHLQGFSVPAEVVSAVDVHEHFMLTFDRERLLAALPLEELEKMEKSRRLISRVDKKGYIPRILKPLLGGAFTIDNKRDEEGDLHLVYISGKKQIGKFKRIPVK